MNATRRILTLALMIGIVPALGACDRDAVIEDDVPPADEITPTSTDVRVTEVELGRSIGTDGAVNDDDEADEFRPTDTVYASVNTEGTAPGTTLTARWTFEDGQVVDETSQTISPTGPAITEFHISRPDGFPVGSYTVEIRLNGQTVETKQFEVQ